jgi:hypothetical protein
MWNEIDLFWPYLVIVGNFNRNHYDTWILTATKLGVQMFQLDDQLPRKKSNDWRDTNVMHWLSIALNKLKKWLLVDIFRWWILMTRSTHPSIGCPYSWGRLFCFASPASLTDQWTYQIKVQIKYCVPCTDHYSWIHIIYLWSNATVLFHVLGVA